VDDKQYKLKIKRFDPEQNSHSRWEEFSLRMEPAQRLLDGLAKIKDEIDGSLTYRRSCAHGVCGSCAMKINGKNSLACQTLFKDMPDSIVIEPLHSFPVIKDLVVDMKPFFEKTEEVLPYLINNTPPPERERPQTPEEQGKILQAITCIMCGSCTSSCPSYQINNRYLGPSTLVKAARFIFDSRDLAEAERLEKIIQSNGIWRCHSIYNCVEACPKNVDIPAHIIKLKQLAVRKKILKRS